MKSKKKIIGILVAFVVLASFTAFLSRQKNEGMLTHAMREASQPSFGIYRENLDDVVLKHIPLGISKAAAIAICAENGFEVSVRNTAERPSGLVPDEFVYCTRSSPSIAYLISSKEFRVILYTKDEKVIATVGRFFIHTL